MLGQDGEEAFEYAASSVGRVFGVEGVATEGWLTGTN